MSGPKRLLILANAVSGAHPARCWVLAQELVDLGYQVYFATSKGYEKYLSPDIKGIKHCSISCMSVDDFNRRLFNGQFIFSEDELVRNLQEDERLIDEIKPDIILSDMRYSALVAARVRGIPFFNINQYHWSKEYKYPILIPTFKLVALFGRTFSSLADPVVRPFILHNMLRQINRFFHSHPLVKEANLPKFKDLFDFYLCGDEVLFVDLPELYPDATVTSHQHFLGPLIWRGGQSGWPEGWPEDFGQKPVALVSMGGTGAHQIIPEILEGLRALNYQIMLSTVGQDYAHLDLRDVWAAPFVPFDKALQHADLLICNGGSATTYHALSYGIPIIALPLNYEQCLHDYQLQKAGVAKMIHSDVATSEAISQAILDLTAKTEQTKTLQTMKTAISTVDYKSTLSKVLQAW
ncbi:MAG: hypothetical protein H6855_03110 [Rhodospirillales bacterium]|nr:hypothetical protein [Rhodospirillales bacterium]MCB9980686.1 hypothetical protein [Rhodospirillales bacterium]